MDREEMKEELWRQMDELLTATADLGFCFAFDVPAYANIAYKKGAPIILWSDDPDFSISIEDLSD